MRPSESEQRIQARQIVDIIRTWCPEDQKMRLERIFREDSKEADTGHMLLQWWVGRLYDGLAYGNWPWIEISFPKSEQKKEAI